MKRMYLLSLMVVTGINVFAMDDGGKLLDARKSPVNMLVEASKVESENDISPKMFPEIIFQGSVFSPHDLRKKDPVILNKAGVFFLLTNANKTAQIQKIKSYNIKGLPKKISIDNLNKFGSNGGYLSLSEANDGQIMIDAKVRGEGGGPVLGEVCYWGTKGVGYAAYFAYTWISHGEGLMHLHEAQLIIETAAGGMRIAGSLAPTG